MLHCKLIKVLINWQNGILNSALYDFSGDNLFSSLRIQMQISVANVQIVYQLMPPGICSGLDSWRFAGYVCVGSHWDNGRSRVWGLRIPIRYEAATERSIRLCCRHDKTIKLNNSIDLCRKFNGIMLLLSSSFKDWTSIICYMASWQRNKQSQHRFRISCWSPFCQLSHDMFQPDTFGNMHTSSELDSRAHHDVIYYRHYRSMRS